MSNLVKYKLTEKAKKLRRIVLPQNRVGDEHMDYDLNTLPDYLAENLFNRKDGRGKEFVELVAKPAPEKAVKKDK